MFKPRAFSIATRGGVLRVGATVLLALACSAESSHEGRDLLATESAEVIGGSPAAVGAWPWQAEIRVGGSHYCGGSLLSPDWVLTAAHCLSGVALTSFSVVLGEHHLTTSDGAEQTRTVRSAVMHPAYGGASPGHNDVGLLRLSSPVVQTDRIRTIRPAVAGDGNGQNSVISGWGNTAPGSGTSPVLMQATLPIQTNASCNAAPNLVRDLFTDELCAGFLNGTSGGCHGDSGGPLTVERSSVRREVVGVVSWGQGFQCGTYTVFARVTSHASWIRSYVFDDATLPGIVLPLT
jgi:secreted trypsin-like serine protease